jgi:hypothetical protein
MMSSAFADAASKLICFDGGMAGSQHSTLKGGKGKATAAVEGAEAFKWNVVHQLSLLHALGVQVGWGPPCVGGYVCMCGRGVVHSSISPGLAEFIVAGHSLMHLARAH